MEKIIKNHEDESYKVWAFDNQVYGPIALPVLKQWVDEGRVDRDTWVYLESQKEWRTAKKIDAIQDHFQAGTETIYLHRQAVQPGGIAPEELRQFAVLASLSNHELAQLVRFGELVEAQSGEVIIQRRDPGDALYFVLSGTVRARLFVGRDEKILASIPAGEFFGEIAMFTQSPRTADVVAADYTRLLR